LDTSFIVRLFESFPRNTYKSVWTKIEEIISARCHIICEVEEELKNKFDEQYAWCVKQKIPVIKIDEESFEEARGIVAKYPGWIRVNTTDLYFADPFVVAHAKATGCIVVTAEREEEPEKKTKDIKIPDVCSAYKVKCIAQGVSELEMAPINKFLSALKIKV
jgi:predicted nucleic acid-binding protein